MRQILTEGFESLGLDITEQILERFSEYNSILAQRNEVMNLTAISGEEDVARLHFLDCAALLTVLDFSGASLIDVGSGAGFPGLPLKIIRPDIKLCLLDSQQKRVSFLKEVCDKLGFDDVNCLWARAEDAAMDIGGSFDVAVSRAVARLNILCELCLPFVSVGGTFIAMKGPDCVEELAQAKKAIHILGGGDSKIVSYQIPGTEIIHSAVMIKKLRPTPEQYPRQFGRIKKSPL